MGLLDTGLSTGEALGLSPPLPPPFSLSFLFFFSFVSGVVGDASDAPSGEEACNVERGVIKTCRGPGVEI